MNTDIISSINSMFGGQTTQGISRLLGESEDATRAGLRTAIPALLAGLMQKTSDAGGAAQLYRTVTSDAVDSGITGKVASLFGSQRSLDSLVAGGESLLGSLLGSRSGAVAHAVSQVSGLKPSSASALLAVGAPLLMGLLKKQVTQGGLDGGGLTSMLLGQRQSLQANGLDNRILGALGVGSMQNFIGSFAEPDTERIATDRVTDGPTYARTDADVPAPRRGRNWLATAAILALAAVAIGLLFNWLGRNRDVDTAGTAPDASALRVASLPAQVYFAQGQATVDAANRRAIEAVADTAQASGQPVALTAYAERTENAAQDLTLANDRAAAVRDVLVSAGIPNDKIVVRPPEVTGRAADTEAQRVEIALAQ